MIHYLKGGDLRSTGMVEQLLPFIKNQAKFDELFSHISNDDRIVTMRAVDAVEKLSATNPGFLAKHKTSILSFLDQSSHIEFKWHVALLVARLPLTTIEKMQVWAKLKKWATDVSESKIVRVNALQAMAELSQNDQELKDSLMPLFNKIEKEKVPSLVARIRKLRKLLAR